MPPKKPRIMKARRSQAMSKSKSKSKSKSASKARRAKVDSSPTWPYQRQIFYRPERAKYVREIVAPKGCVFCHALEKGVGFESLLLYQNEFAIVVMNKYPYNTGHLLVLPRRHSGSFVDLGSEEYKALTELLQHTVRILTEVFQPSGFNVGLNLGSAAGAGIPEHLHFHVIPRWTGDTNFFPLIAQTKVVVETLEETFGRLVLCFDRLD